VFENVGWGEILVLIIAGLFILGPERLPEAAAWLGRTIRQVRDFATGTREQLTRELGPELEGLRAPLRDLRQPLEELRGLRNFDPKRAVVRSLFNDDPPRLSGLLGSDSGTTNGSNSGSHSSSSSGQSNSGQSSSGQSSSGQSSSGQSRPLAPDERPPIDPDAT
jgi:sec-independent protein translocase protein TatB